MFWPETNLVLVPHDPRLRNDVVFHLAQHNICKEVHRRILLPDVGLLHCLLARSLVVRNLDSKILGQREHVLLPDNNCHKL
jgi:hypothetical protein